MNNTLASMKYSQYKLKPTEELYLANILTRVGDNLRGRNNELLTRVFLSIF